MTFETKLVTDIEVRDGRTRQHFDDEKIEDLACSIYSVGLINPVVLEDDSPFLATGERRLRAVTLLFECGLPIRHRGADVPLGHVPVIEHWAENDLQRLQAEVDENLQREGLTWQEQAIAEAKLHELRIKQHGEHTFGIPGVSEGSAGWSKAQTAAELYGPKAAIGQRVKDVSDSIELSDFMDDPMVAGAKTRRDAVKMMRDIKKAQERQRRAAAVVIDDIPHKLHHASYLEAPIDPGSIDIFIIDPPYGRNMDKHKFGTNHKYDDSEQWWQEHIVDGLLPARMKELAAPQSHAYIFCDFLRFQELFIAMEIAGWTCLRRPIIWDKGHIGTYGNHEYEPRHVYDCILHARRGDRPFMVMDRDVIDDVEYLPDRLDHPAGKPHALYANLLRRSAHPGDRVADLMCGGGSIFPAAQSARCTAIGVELSEEYYNIAKIALGETKQ